MPHLFASQDQSSLLDLRHANYDKSGSSYWMIAENIRTQEFLAAHMLLGAENCPSKILNDRHRSLEQQLLLISVCNIQTNSQKEQMDRPSSLSEQSEST